MLPDSAAATAEARARDVLLLRAVEESGTPAWTAADADWATRLARDADAPDFLAERARHALHRLSERDRVPARLQRATRWHPSWIGLAGVLGLAAGSLVDHIGPAQRIDLLAPPVWALVAWNLALGMLALGSAVVRALRRAPPRERMLARWWRHRWSDVDRGAVAARFAGDWARVAAPLAGARAALLMHVAASALALGLAGGLYLRGLVLDYRVGWQSTFLQPATVQAVLDVALAPASRFSGVAVPAVAAWRDGPAGQPAAGGPVAAEPGSAAPWLHLYATTLLLAVIAPRGALAAWAAWRARRAAQRLTLPLHEPYFQRLLARRGGGPRAVVIQPVGCRPAPATVLAVHEHLARRWGEPLQVEWREAVAPEDPVAPPAPVASGTAVGAATVQLALFDLAATPEDEVHGRWLDARSTSQPLAGIVVDGLAYAQRFASMPTRVAERRRLWQDFASRRALGCEVVGA